MLWVLKGAALMRRVFENPKHVKTDGIEKFAILPLDYLFIWNYGLFIFLTYIQTLYHVKHCFLFS